MRQGELATSTRLLVITLTLRRRPGYREAGDRVSKSAYKEKDSSSDAKNVANQCKTLA